LIAADLVSVAEELFAILDFKSTQHVDAVVVNAVVQQLREAVTRTNDGPAAYVRVVRMHLSVLRKSLSNLQLKSQFCVEIDSNDFGKSQIPIFLQIQNLSRSHLKSNLRSFPEIKM